MTEKPDNLTLVMLRRIEERMGGFEEKLDRLVEDVHGMSCRLAPTEESLTVAHRRLDRSDNRLERIERRFVDAVSGGVRG